MIVKISLVINKSGLDTVLPFNKNSTDCECKIVFVIFKTNKHLLPFHSSELLEKDSHSSNARSRCPLVALLMSRASSHLQSECHGHYLKEILNMNLHKQV
jgi:hypothetical protein